MRYIIVQPNGNMNQADSINQPIPDIDNQTPVTETTDTDESYNDYEITGCCNPNQESSRREGWERKLLDLSLRNSMLNLRPGKSIAPIMEQDVDAVVKHLKSNTLSQFVGIPDQDNTDLLKHLYRSARTTLEENGANSLFVAIGSIKWFDVDDKRSHIAPLLFIPVSMVRKKAMNYEIRMRDDEAMTNVTLIEMMHQMFGITFPEFDAIPEDAHGFPDWRAIFNIFTPHIEEINKHQAQDKQWQLSTQSFIGIFSFKKFLMWHDIHDHPDIVERHPVLKGLISNHYGIETESDPLDAHTIEENITFDLMLPIDYDSSQLEAVAESHASRSFVLHGPPGTGKSQTITNMIADAVFNGKKVLFVSEKKAALDVVKSRLEKIGLSPYCLELHSNKTDKRSFFTQLSNSEIRLLSSKPTKEIPASYYEGENLLKDTGKYLSEISEAIHTERSAGLSLYDFICRYLKIGYESLALSHDQISHLSPSDISQLSNDLRSLDLVAKILGFHPSQSSLMGLFPNENTAENQKDITETVNALPRRVERARKKAASRINRWFIHKTAEQIFYSDNLWLKLDSLADISSAKNLDIDSIDKCIGRWNSGIAGLRKWYHFTEKAAEINKKNLPASLDMYLSGKSGEETASATESGYYKTLAFNILDNDSKLRIFNGETHKDRAKLYCRVVDLFQNRQRTALEIGMKHRLSSTNLDIGKVGQLNLLIRRMMNNGRGVPLRQIIANSSDILHMVYPCMLMSPLSVAQYLEMKPDIFDLVIFDEASQMETPDAIGAIARGNNVIVVGDPKQLPPTRFFTARSSSGEEIEESEDADSILEDCIALGMPSKYLSRHYRSRHESLITFSNSNFYNGRLLTFPSCNDAERKVSFIDPKGVYDYGKTRTNAIEAEAVVDKVLELLKNSDTTPSIGVVAFSKAQSNLIEDILNTKLQQEKVLQRKLDMASEPLFIKNLENVQGDERDIIIFSICYGPDKNGKVYLNFGPINKIGGERRLNVAVSRAREEMFVFSSLHPANIPEGDNISKGAAALRDFLSFAENPSMVDKLSGNDLKDYIAEDIAAKLRQKGYTVKTKIGRSSLKIDVAVSDPETPDKYMAGVILDSRDYHSLPTVRDREVTVPSVLRSLGWDIKRIWVIDWLENPDRVLEEILSGLLPPPSQDLAMQSEL